MSDRPKKRRLVSKACDYCRKRHRKCDGTTPCALCKSKGIDCTYSPSKKRGPKYIVMPVYTNDGKSSLLPPERTKATPSALVAARHGHSVVPVSVVEALHDELQKQKKNVRTWKDKYVNLLQQKTTNVSVPKPRFYVVSDDAMNSYMTYFKHYIAPQVPNVKFYEENASNVFRSMLLPVDTWTFLNEGKSRAELLQQLSSSVVFAHGALLSGRRDQASSFIEKSEALRTMLSTVHNISNTGEPKEIEQLVVLLFCLGMLYESQGRPDKKRSCMLEAYSMFTRYQHHFDALTKMRMFSELIELSKTEEDRLHWFNLAKDLCTAQSVQNSIVAQVYMALMIVSTMTHRFTITEKVTCAKVKKEKKEKKKEQKDDPKTCIKDINESQQTLLFDVIARIESLTRRQETNVSSPQDAMWIKFLKTIINALKATVYLAAGDIENALYWSTLSVEVFETIGGSAPFVVALAMYLSIYVFHFCKESEMLKKVTNLMSNMAQFPHVQQSMHFFKNVLKFCTLHFPSLSKNQDMSSQAPQLTQPMDVGEMPEEPFIFLSNEDSNEISLNNMEPPPMLNAYQNEQPFGNEVLGQQQQAPGSVLPFDSFLSPSETEVFGSTHGHMDMPFMSNIDMPPLFDESALGAQSSELDEVFSSILM